MLRLFTSARVLARVGPGFLSAAVFVDTAAAETSRVGNSGAGLGTMTALGETYGKSHPEVTVSMASHSGSSGGIKAVLAGKIDIGLSSRAPKSEEEAQEARGIEYGRTPLMAVVHAENPLKNITSAQLAGYPSARATAQPDDTPVRLALRPESDSDASTLKAFPPQVNEAVTPTPARPGMIGAAANEKGADDPEHIPGAPGILTLASIASEARHIKFLAVYEVQPSEAIRSGNYPHYKIQLLALQNPVVDLRHTSVRGGAKLHPVSQDCLRYADTRPHGHRVR